MPARAEDVRLVVVEQAPRHAVVVRWLRDSVYDANPLNRPPGASRADASRP